MGVSGVAAWGGMRQGGLVATLKAALWVPDGPDMMRALAVLSAHADRNGWDARTRASNWPELIRLLAAGQVDIGLITSRRDLPAGRLPRIVALDDPPVTDGPRRPRRLWAPRPASAGS